MGARDTTGADMVRALRAMRSRFRAGGHASLRDLVDTLGSRSAALGSALLALPFLWPLSLGPLTAPASALIAYLGLQLLRGDSKTGLPGRLLSAPVPFAIYRMMVRFTRVTLKWNRRIARPRLARLVAGSRGRNLCGVGLIAGAVLLAVPVPMMPLTNTFPALGIVLCALGWSERDGALVIAGWVSQFLGALLMAAIALVVAWFGWEVIHAVLPSLKGGN